MKNDLEKKVMRKVTLRIIPFIMLLYFIAFLDRVNIRLCRPDHESGSGIFTHRFWSGRWHFLPWVIFCLRYRQT